MSLGPISDARVLEEKAHELLNRLKVLRREATPMVPRQPVELYHRAAHVLRVSRRRGGKSVEIQRGRDEGLAVRIRSTGGRVSFGAASGTSNRSLRWAVAQARRGHAMQLGDPRDPWAPGRERPRIDWDEVQPVPTDHEVEEWLDQAWDRLESGLGGRFQAETAWAELATTIESWVADGGLRASRTRTRAWAVALPRATGKSPVRPQPLTTAARTWADLDIGGWQALAADRVWPPGGTTKRSGGRTAVLFSPEASAMLVLALVKALNTPDHLGLEVGPAWKMADDPLERDALFGGDFDDGGFPTTRRQLADGRRLVGRVQGQGSWRRPSFRDPPRPMPCLLRVEAESGNLPSRGILVSTMTLHPLAPENWVIEFDGGVLADGTPRAPVRNGFIHVAPAELVRRCVGAFGPVRSNHRGVQTPALIFDDLRVDSVGA